MTTPTVVQYVTVHKDTGGPWSSGTITFSAATAGNTILIVATCAPTGFNGNHLHEPSGYTRLCSHNESSDDSNIIVARKVAAGGETSATVTVFHNPNTSDDSTAATATRIAIWMVEVDGDFGGYALSHSGGSPFTLPTIAPTAGADALIFALGMNGNAYGISTHPSGYTYIDEVVANTGASERLAGYSRIASPASGSYSGSWTYAGGVVRFKGVQVWFSAFPEVTASFDYTPTSGDAPLAVTVTDTSDDAGLGIDAWLWDWGDGTTSSGQSPAAHTYDESGNYTITLTITVDGDDYTATGTVNVTEDVGYVAPEPGIGIVEIYANDPGSARWDQANWDEAVWSQAGWQNVTPQATQVQILWGSRRPELGILSTPDAASWAIDFGWDPDRILDPANEDSPYFGDLEPALPVRVRHGSTVIKQGQVESLGHSFEDESSYMRVTDAQSIAANSTVPHDTTLSDTLFARARDAIAAAGLTITVLPDPAAGDPALVPWEDTGTDQSVWAWIVDAADQVLWMPYLDRQNQLGFRPFSGDRLLDRGRSITSENTVGLSSVVDINGVYNVVTVLDEDGVTLVTREVTPKPSRFGTRVYDQRKDQPTPNAGDWAQAVLDDRANVGRRWTPGEVVPFTADEVKYFGTIEPIERITFVYPEAVPPVLFDAIVVGGTILITPKDEEGADWTFVYFTAETPLVPLVSDDDGVSYLVRDDDPTEYLYPDG